MVRPRSLGFSDRGAFLGSLSVGLPFGSRDGVPSTIQPRKQVQSLCSSFLSSILSFQDSRRNRAVGPNSRHYPFGAWSWWTPTAHTFWKSLSANAYQEVARFKAPMLATLQSDLEWQVWRLAASHPLISGMEMVSRIDFAKKAIAVWIREG